MLTAKRFAQPPDEFFVFLEFVQSKAWWHLEKFISSSQQNMFRAFRQQKV